MADEQTPHIAEGKRSAREAELAELKKRLVESRMKSVDRQTNLDGPASVNLLDGPASVNLLDGPVNIDPASIDELIRTNSGGLATPTITEQDAGLLDRVLQQVQSHKATPPPAKRTAIAKRHSEPAPQPADTVIHRMATEPARPVISTPPDIVMADAINHDRPHLSTPASSSSDGSLARLLEQDEGLKDWLALTNYHDVESRNRKLEVYRERHREKIRKVQALEAQMKQMEAERRKLMEEVEPDMGFLWPTTAAPVPLGVDSTPKPSDSTPKPNDSTPKPSDSTPLTSIKKSTEFKRESFDAVSAKRTLPTIPTEASHRAEKQARVDATFVHAGKQTPNHRDQEQYEIDKRDSHRKDGYQSNPRYIKFEDDRRALLGRESPPRRPRDRSPHGSPPGRRVPTNPHGPRRPDWNEHRGQDNGSYRREPETARRPLGRNGPPSYFDVGANGDTRYFIVKSWTEENVYQCMEEGIWVTQQHNEALLNQAFTQNKNVILFFSANQSKAFQGYARMISPTSPKNPTPRWVSGLRWPCSNPFRVRWLSKIEVEFFRIGHLRNSFNENMAVLVGKDGQEIEERCGASLLAEMFAIAQDKYERRDASLSFRNQ